MGYFGLDLELRCAVRAVNAIIERAAEHDGGVYMVEKDNPDFSVKLTRPIDIVSWEQVGGNRR